MESQDHRHWTQLYQVNLCDEFVFQKITPNRSDANLFAVTALTLGNTERCLIACSSYVSGDRGVLQSWSMSSFEIENGLCNITAPDDKDLSQFTKCHTVALPYVTIGKWTKCDIICSTRSDFIFVCGLFKIFVQHVFCSIIHMMVDDFLYKNHQQNNYEPRKKNKSHCDRQPAIVRSFLCGQHIREACPF